MKIRYLVALFLSLSIGVPDAWAQKPAPSPVKTEQARPARKAPPPAPRPRGRAFLNAPVNSAEEYARIIERCNEREMRSLNLSCDELVDSFNAAFDEIEDVDNVQELAAYVRTLAFRPCPQRSVEIARVVNSKVDYFSRELKFNEMCLVDLNHNRVISSAVCGQWVRTNVGLVFTQEGTRPGDESSLRNSIDRAGQDSDRLSQDTPERRPGGFTGWLSRHKKWLIPAGIGAGAALLLVPRATAESETHVEVRIR